MKNHLKIIAAGLTFFFFLSSFFISSAAGSHSQENMKKNIQKIFPVAIPFIENRGQIQGKDVLYYARTSHGTVFITKNGDMVYSLAKTDRGDISVRRPVRESLKGSTLSCVQGDEPALTKIHYLRGTDPDAWIKNIPTYSIVRLRDVYKGIDVTLQLNGNNMEKVFLVQPGGDVSSIKVALEGVDETKINKKGELELETDAGLVHLTKPLAYQEINGKEKRVDVAYELRENGYGFKVGAYDKKQTLVIDPVLSATFLGGSGEDYITAIALDSSGNVYAAGYTNSSDFPGIGSPMTGFPSTQGFIVKLVPDLSAISAATYVGGSGDDQIEDLKLDNAGNVYVSGYTKSHNFPGINAGSADSTFSGGSEAFVAKLPSALSSISAATFLGGNNDESAKSIAIDNAGNVYATGFTGSADFPGITTDSADHSFNADGTFKGRYEGFVVKLDTDLSSILSATFIGGENDDMPLAIALDKRGDVGQYSSIALDSNGKVHISYYDATNQTLNYATNASGLWVSETVDTGNVGQYSSIAVDSGGNVHISYYDATNTNLKYATGTFGSWSIETVDDTVGTDDVGQYSSIAVDSGGNVHISYYDATNTNLKYATGTFGSWSIETVDDTVGTDDVGQYSSIAVDSGGNVHISYYDATNTNLKYATGTFGSWSIETVDDTVGTDDVGQYSSIAVDSGGNVHISYYDATNTNLKYATGTFGSWSIETVDDTVGTDDVGQYSSIAVDSGGNVHISYYDATNTNLKYATGTFGSWSIETVDDTVGTDDVGQYSSIALNSAEQCLYQLL